MPRTFSPPKVYLCGVRGCQVLPARPTSCSNSHRLSGADGGVQAPLVGRVPPFVRGHTSSQGLSGASRAPHPLPKSLPLTVSPVDPALLSLIASFSLETSVDKNATCPQTKGFDGASVGWEATPLRVVTVTGSQSCKGRSRRGCGLRQPRGTWWPREGAEPPCAPPAPCRQPGPRGRREGKQETPFPPMVPGGCCAPGRAGVSVGVLRGQTGPPAWCPSTGPLREPGWCVCMVRGTEGTAEQS